MQNEYFTKICICNYEKLIQIQKFPHTISKNWHKPLGSVHSIHKKIHFLSLSLSISLSQRFKQQRCLLNQIKKINNHNETCLSYLT